MKPLLSVAVKEALKLALNDTIISGDARLCDLDLDALGQALCCRLLGYGGWDVQGVYAGNASPQELLHASIENPGRRQIQDVVDALGLEEEPFKPKLVD